MAQTSLSGTGPWLPGIPTHLATPLASNTSLLIDATGEKAAFVGRVWFKERTGTKSIRRVGFRWGTITKAGGSALTISLQDVDLSNGPVGRPDGTQDQTVAVANADAAFVSNAWYRSGALSADRTVTYGDRLAVVVEFDGAGRLGADSVIVHSNNAATAGGGWLETCINALFTSSWAAVVAIPNIVLEFSDGTFGTLEGSYISESNTSTNINSGTGSADEYALAFKVDAPCKVDGLWAMVLPAASANFELILYSGTTALVTVTIDFHTLIAAGTARIVRVPIAEQSLTPGTQYYVAVRPTTANNVTVYWTVINDANHMRAMDGGPDFNYATRLDQGSWAAVTATRRFLAGVRISSMSDDAGSQDIRIGIYDGHIVNP